MTHNRDLNALQSSVLALALAAGPALGLAYSVIYFGFQALGLEDAPMFGSLLITWAPAGLIGGLFWIRPVENFIRRHGYQLGSVEERHGVDFEDGYEDATSDAVAEALAERLAEEMRG
jgi:hypothetical protein